MLRLRLDSIPCGIIRQTQLIGELMIANNGSGTHARGNYDVTLRLNPGQAREAQVHDFPREQGAWALVQAALRALGEER